MGTEKPVDASSGRSFVKSNFEKICVIGLGYVGLPTAAVFAGRGVQVLGVDINKANVSLINLGKTHIVEPDLDILVNGAVATGKLRASVMIESADAFIIAVPTPLREDNKPDLQYVRAAAESLAPVLKPGNLVVIESTCPVGTTEAFSGWLAERRPDLTFPHQSGNEADVRVAHSPERVLPGRVLLELVRNDRVVGGLSSRCSERAAELYRLAVEGKCLLTNARTAELVKLAENAYRDVNIAFANELSLVCDRLDIDVWEAVHLANHHPRVNVLNPGPGVGGHCIAVDPWFIVDSAPDETPLIRAARRVNDGKPKHIVDKVLAKAQDFAAPCIACLGLAYKADIDDLRESPAVEIVRMLGESGKGKVLAVEPYINALPDRLASVAGIRLTDLDTALAAAHIVILLVDHKPFKDIDQKRLQGKTVFDTRGAWR